MSDELKALMAMMGQNDHGMSSDLSLSEQVNRAINYAEGRDIPANFKVGDFVTQKPGMKVCQLPTDSTPGLVLELHPQESLTGRIGQDDKHCSDGNAGRVENVLIAVCDPDGDVVTFWFDERFLTKHEDASKLADERRKLLEAA